jgi:hypothetical protein
LGPRPDLAVPAAGRADVACRREIVAILITQTY